MNTARAIRAAAVAVAAAGLLGGCAGSAPDVEYRQYAMGDAPFDWWATVPWVEDLPVAYWVETPDGTVLRFAMFDGPYCPQLPQSFSSDGAGTFHVVFRGPDLGPGEFCPSVGGMVVTDFPVEAGDVVDGAQLVVEGTLANLSMGDDGTPTPAPITIPVQTDPDVSRPF